jgi:hypothetical protein
MAAAMYREEIATACGLAMTVVDDRWFFDPKQGSYPGWSALSDPALLDHHRVLSVTASLDYLFRQTESPPLLGAG